MAVGFVLDLLLEIRTGVSSDLPDRSADRFYRKKTRALFPKTKTGERTAGGVTALIVVLISTGIPVLLLVLAYHLSFAVGVLAEAVVCYFVLATKSLKKESMNVKKALEQEGLRPDGKMVSRIVGRDDQNPTNAGVIKAAGGDRSGKVFRQRSGSTASVHDPWRRSGRFLPQEALIRWIRCSAIKMRSI
ncbi:MAG: cobalamin biosynthesis protein [Lachnospiraceae bacterium]